MADESTPLWARQVAARATGTPAPEKPATADERPAWARAVADRAAGRTPDPEAVREAREAGRKPRAEWEQRLLDRLGHGPEDDSPPDAA